MSKFLIRNRKIAAVRGEKWKHSLVKAKFQKKSSNTTLAHARVKLGKSQNEIAESLQICLASYSLIERGRGVKRPMASYLASYFKGEIDTFFYQSCGKFFARILEGGF